MAEPLSNPDKNIDRDYPAVKPERELPGADFPELMDPERELRSSDYDRSDSDYDRSEYEGSDYARSLEKTCCQASPAKQNCRFGSTPRR